MKSLHRSDRVDRTSERQHHLIIYLYLITRRVSATSKHDTVGCDDEELYFIYSTCKLSYL